MTPESGSCNPERIFSSVDLPAPFSPIRPITWFRGISSETFFTAVTGPNALVMPVSLRAGVPAAAGFFSVTALVIS